MPLNVEIKVRCSSAVPSVSYVVPRLQEEMDFATPFHDYHRHTSHISLAFFSISPRHHVQQERWQQSRSHCWSFRFYASLGWPKCAWTQRLSRWRRDQCPANCASKNSHVSFQTVLWERDMFVFASDYTINHFSRYIKPKQTKYYYYNYSY